MPLPANLIPSREEIIKERERERLHRYLFIKFGRKKFDMYWTNEETSFTDYSSIYVKYQLQTPAHRLFNLEEMRMLRKGHALHERGHIEYDVSGVTYNWRMNNVSADKKDWAANFKYPMGWLKYFSGIMVDVRMENFVIVDLPETKQYFDFCNYNWRFGIRGEHAGEDRLYDFRECLASRGFNLTDIPEWHPEAVELVESVESMIRDVQFSSSTQEGMDNTSRIVKEVWPTLYEWMVQDSQEDKEPEENESGHDNSNWGDPDDVKQNSDRVVMKIQLTRKNGEEDSEGKGNDKSEDENEESKGNSSKKTNGEPEENSNSIEQKGESPHDPNDEDQSDGESGTEGENEAEDCKKPDFKGILTAISAELKADEKAADDEVGPYLAQLVDVKVGDEKKDRKAYSDKVVLIPYHGHDSSAYVNLKEQVKRQIQPTSSTLKKLLDPTPDQKYTNQRSGRLNVTKVWSASIMDDPNVFNRHVKGTPAQEARILVLDDISGSTGGWVTPGVCRIDAMKKAMVLLSEATEAAKIPTAVYAFTEDRYSEIDGRIMYPLTGSEDPKTIKLGTIIHPLKPYGRLGNVEKGFIGALEPQNGNRDTLALQWAVDALKPYHESIRLLIVLSDGEPCFSANEDENTMRSIVQQAQKQGIDVLCLFIGPEHSFPAVKNMYPGGAIFVSKNLIRDLTQQVMQIIKRRRK
ncbi:hypothetical protein EHV15_36070 [Paenibacillus oralis]|uniref:VWA domain-containing protein n=1 Tax=Paenibacillus oralis TaxID=2490856 RepID=A0A3P3TAE4_9BACL|nr:hypothetical protein [Paenibacillus oralis]RRJ54987.1 hypothetical protein EHV15_36070 [Paenibacillus oralis]